MTLRLYECLKAVGLHSHFASFTSLGVHQAAHLSDLTMEDYPFLGIRSMEDRTRLFHLVQMLKTLNLEYEDVDDDPDAGDKGYPGAYRNFTDDSSIYPCDNLCADDHERGAAVSKLNAPHFSKPSHVCRRLDFSCETLDPRLNLFSCPEEPVHVRASHIRNIVPCQGKGSAIPVQLATGSGCKEKKNHRMDFHTSISNKVVGQKGRKGILRRENFCSNIRNNMPTEHNTKPTPVYQSKRTAGYNYGLPLTSPPVPNKNTGSTLTRFLERRAPTWRCTGAQHILWYNTCSMGKATCFAYGQTGAGKTHTMLGSAVRPGLYALAVLDIFAHISTTHVHSPLLVYVSFFEIYCGQLYDLLDHRKRLFAREDGQKVVHIVGLCDVRVDSVGSLLEVISRGTEERTQGMSGVNPVSSRSHALLQIQIRDANQHIAGRMWFVDLAGSEKASDTKEPDRQSRMEGAEINQSLLALKECIRSLDQEQSHTPFRQSKLTQVLKDSFVGDSMTCMIANISPGHLATEHTLNTLRYADRVKELGGQLGLRGRRRGKPTHSAQCNLYNSSSGSNVVGTRGKSPPKKPNLGRQTPIFAVPTPTTRLTTEHSILCSTPKKGRREGETCPSTRKRIGFEKIIPVRGLLGIRDSMEREGRREGYGVTDSLHNAYKKSIVAAEDEQILLREVQKSEFNHKGTDSHRSTWKGGTKEERSWMEQERRVKTSRDTCSKEASPSEREKQKDDKNSKERERHLRQYHQQLQQFIPSSASSSIHLLSPSTCPSFSSSNQDSLSSSKSSCSPLQQSSRLSVFDLVYHDIDEVSLRGESGCNNQVSSFFPSGEICLPTETSPSYRDEIGQCGLASFGKKMRVSREETGAKLGQHSGKHENRSQKETGQGEGRLRREEWRPCGIEGATKSETERANMNTGAMPADAEALVVDGVWSAEDREGADGCGLLPIQSNIDTTPLHPPLAESSRQRAPAERPLSPACEHADKLLTSVMQSISSSVQLSENSNSAGSQNLMPYGATHVPSEYAGNTLWKPPFSISTQRSDSVGQLNAVPTQCHTVHSNHPGNSNVSLQQSGSVELNGQGSTSNRKITPIFNLPTLEDLDDGRWCVVQAHWEQLEEMEALFRKDSTLLCQQPDMAFGEYAHKLVDIMERKARCAQSMITQLQPFLKPSHSK
ncbi:uncharacterized protein LOC120830537 isoform X2 [Gasterosteus aculeatus]